MGKKRRKKKKDTSNVIEDFGTCELYCKDCDYTFEIEWETIFSIQECTHGYVGFDLNDVFIDCPKCGKIVTDNDSTLSDTSSTKQNSMHWDDELPF
jgi:5-methylcytosine-specific restriction endonuclease McrA